MQKNILDNKVKIYSSNVEKKTDISLVAKFFYYKKITDLSQFLIKNR